MTLDIRELKTVQQSMEAIERLNSQLLSQAERIKELEELLETARADNIPNRERLQKLLSYIVSFLPFAHKTEATLVLKSGLFDREYYLTQFSDRNDFKMACRNPIRHYLTIGGFDGLDPSPGFDSRWYLSKNSDVRAAGVNPLVHYIRYGEQEGRFPRHGVVGAGLGGLPVSAGSFNRKLWGGFSHIVLPELAALADDGLNSGAAWYLAAWHYAHGEVESALERVKQSIANTRGGANSRALIGLAKCYTVLQETEGLESIVKNPHMAQKLGTAYPYIQANMVNGQSRWDAWAPAVNEVFYRVGLAGIAIRDSDRGPSLDNLIGINDQRVFDDKNSDELPLISVIVPAYNAASTLPIALDSLLAQSWSALEIIVVDDGSDDNTVEIAQAYAARDSRVQCVPNAKNMGAYTTRNNGMRAARGEFVTVHDSDDWSHPQKLERQILPLIGDPEKIATISSWIRVTDDMRFVGPWLLRETFVEKNHSSVVIRRSVLGEIGYWDAVNVAGDTEFLWRLEHNYGDRSILHVLPSTPLSFALADDSSLTRAKSTHVKTIHYGLRRIYREAARWWHQCSGEKPVLGATLLGEDERSLQPVSSIRPFPIPLGIARGTSREFERVLVGDFSAREDYLPSTLDAIEREVFRGTKFCLFHWPSYTGWHGAPIADEVFELCQRHRLNFAHMGLTIKSKKVVMIDTELWRYPPSHAVQIEGLQKVETLDGGLAEPQSEMLTYFLHGGVEPSVEI